MNKRILQSIGYKFLHDFNNRYFNLKFPIILKVSKCKKFTNKYRGMWQNESLEIKDGEWKEYHVITISYPDLSIDIQDLQNTIFHELVHAKQYELKREVWHDLYFWEWENRANKIGITIRYLEDNYREIIPE